MFALFGPRIPSSDVAKGCLPQEYKNLPDLYQEGEETESKVNLLVTRREAFFSANGFVVNIGEGVHYRIWARLHYDQAKKPNGMILCCLSSGRFEAWKGDALCPESKAIQRFEWKDGGFTFNEKVDDLFPSIFSSLLKMDEETKENPLISCEIEEVKPEDLEKVRKFCGTARLPLPGKLYREVYPKTPFERALPFLGVIGAAAAVYFLWSRSK